MNEHEKLKEICKKIWYSLLENWIDWDWYNHYFWKEMLWWVWVLPWFKRYDVRQIIFTQEFMDKYLKYYSDNIWMSSSDQIVYRLSLNLDNPTEYLYNLTN